MTDLPWKLGQITSDLKNFEEQQRVLVFLQLSQDVQQLALGREVTLANLHLAFALLERMRVCLNLCINAKKLQDEEGLLCG